MDLSAQILFDLLFRKTLAGYACIAGIMLLVYLFVAKHPKRRAYAAVLFWILAWTMYDVFGYDYVVLTNGQYSAAVQHHPALVKDYQIGLNAYRIIQMTFQWVLTFLVVFAAGWRAGLAANLVWWGANCDILYYLITWRDLPKVWTWLGWTPVGIFVDTISLPVVLVQAVVCLCAAGMVLVIKKK